jgi:hypothetical protein
MATRAITVTEYDTGKKENDVATWATLANTDDGAPYNGPARQAISVQVSGVFGAGGNLIIEGSNDGTTYAILDDLDSAALGTITAAGLYQVRDRARYIRPRVSAGDGTTALVVTLVAA